MQKPDFGVTLDLLGFEYVQATLNMHAMLRIASVTQAP